MIIDQMNRIYGFGNALIDLEIQIQDDELESINIKKGNMRHISENELKTFMDRFSNNINSRLPGGSIANSLYAANQHGASIHFSCSVGKDDYGDYFIDSFGSNKNLISYERSPLPTGICLIFVTEDGQRTMAAHLGANLDLNEKALNLEKLKNSNYLLFDNFSLSSKNGLTTVIAALREKNNAEVCFGVSDEILINENLENLKWLSQNKLDLIYGNREEIAKLRKELNFFSDNILETNGENGASYNGNIAPAPKIDIVNSNGAGDALIGAFLAHKGNYDEKTALFKSVGYASRVCRVNGPRLA